MTINGQNAEKTGIDAKFGYNAPLFNFDDFYNSGVVFTLQKK